MALAAAASRPNVLVIVADDLGYGELGCQGFTRQIPTPNIDSIADNGVRFTSGYVSGPYCSPTRAGLMTGRYQTRFGHEFNPGPAQVGQQEVRAAAQRNDDRRPAPGGRLYDRLVREIASRVRAAVSSAQARV